jgi:spore maturation protein CgeB
MTRPKILFAGYLDPGSTARHRVDALGRLGYDVVPFNFSDYGRGGGRILNWVYYHLLVGPEIDRVNKDLVREAERHRPRFIYVEKGIFLKPRTIRYLSKFVAPTIQFNYDNPFGSRGDPGWRLFLAAIPDYDVHFVPRESSIADFQKAGARHVFRMPLSFDPAIHYPPPPDWGEGDRTIDVSFTGTPYDNRGAFLTALLTDYGIETDIMGDRWNRVLSPDIAARLYKGPSVYDELYRRRFWQSKICLSFVTHSNQDQVAHKSFEIAGAGGFLLAEATDEHRAAFVNGEEAVFFEDVADCARLIRKYLPEPELRARIAKAGHARAVSSGYSNDARLKKAFAIVQDIFPERL